MCAMSQQVLYGELFKDIEDDLNNIDDYAWGEELFEFQIIVYTKGRNFIPGYQYFRKEAVEVGLITINPHAVGMIEVVTALYVPSSKRLYIKEDAFNKHWKHLKQSLAIGIENNAEYCKEKGIKNPEDIVDLKLLRTRNKEPYVTKNGRINYKADKQEQAEVIELKRARQSKLDNPKNIFFYSSNRDASRQIHDKECVELSHISDLYFYGSAEVPDGYILCKRCKRKLLIRMGCYPNTKQIPICNRMFQKYRVFTAVIEKIVDEGITFHSEDGRIITVNGIEDTWQIRAVGDSLSLWHNNYVRVNETERYITEGFHEQNFKGTMSMMFNYIENYTWQKHLDAEVRK